MVAQVKALFPSVPFTPRHHTSSHQPATDGHSFPVIDTVKAEDSRSSGLQKEAAQNEELAPQEPQWRYQLPIPGAWAESQGQAGAVGVPGLGGEVPECVPASTACLTRSPW